MSVPQENDWWQRKCDKQEEELQRIKDELECMKSKCLSLQTIKESAFHIWTNFPNRRIFNAIAEYLKGTAGNKLKNWRGPSQTTKHKRFTGNKPGPPRKLAFEEEFFLVVVKLKTGFHNIRLQHLLGISESLISQIFTTWLTFLSYELKILFEMPEDCHGYEDGMANCFKHFPNLKVVLDCTELRAQKSSDLKARKEMFSPYKGTETIKFNVGLATYRGVNYCSKAYGKYITMSSPELLAKLPPGCKVMSDKGFNFTEELQELGVELIIPDFKGRDSSQMFRDECAHSEWVAKTRIHVERIIHRYVIVVI